MALTSPPSPPVKTSPPLYHHQQLILASYLVGHGQKSLTFCSICFVSSNLATALQPQYSSLKEAVVLFC